ncbi:DUF3069 domain-containing protein [Shewanella sp. NIFS-20-20]|uniref:DUF3069 domain-containing protein n=1 Tax=Shewanella sp. NIFS-20-20 TaxID=2853806 RepID=UPI001C451978|nr:DUF3069 domain-containing protein [Shewanella sp. NIFS-20-20]MBV7315981.1 DUF3069 domain-containing protein [Shewanella sp. NIFS-20-20]
MTDKSAQYRETARLAAFNVSAKVLPMDEMPQNLHEAFADLYEQLIVDNDGLFVQHYQAIPASARALISEAEFHGFFIGHAWLKLTMAGQEIAERQDSDDEVNEQAYAGIFAKLIEQALKESIKKLKKARTDRSMLNSIKQVIA